MKSFLQYLQENSQLYTQSIDDVEDNATKRLFNRTSENLKKQNIPSELQQALERYVGGDDINIKLRAGEIDPLAKQMDELIHKFGIKRDTPTTVWRVMPSKFIKSGAEPGFLSTTLDRKVALSRAARIPGSSVLKIDIPAGTPHVSNITGNWTGENELVFGRNQNLEIDPNPKNIKVVKDIPALPADPVFDLEARPRQQKVTEIPVHRVRMVTDTPKPVTSTPKPKQTPKPITPSPELKVEPSVPKTGMLSRFKLPSLGQVADVLDINSPAAVTIGAVVDLAKANWDAIKTTPSWAAEKMGQKVETPDAALLGQLEDGQEERQNKKSRYSK